MSFAPAIIQAGATAFQVIGSLKQAQSQQSAAQFNQQIALQNVGLARRQARVQAQQIERKNRLRLGAIRAAQGASGGRQGDISDFLADVATQGELERQEAIFQGELSARTAGNQAQLAGMRAKSARTAGRFAAGRALLGGISDTSSLLKRER